MTDPMPTNTLESENSAHAEASTDAPEEINVNWLFFNVFSPLSQWLRCHRETRIRHVFFNWMRASQEYGLLASVFAAWDYVVCSETIRRDIWDERNEEMRDREADQGLAACSTTGDERSINIPERMRIRDNLEELVQHGMQPFVAYDTEVGRDIASVSS